MASSANNSKWKSTAQKWKSEALLEGIYNCTIASCMAIRPVSTLAVSSKGALHTGEEDNTPCLHYSSSQHYRLPEWDLSWGLNLRPEVWGLISLILFWIILLVIEISHFPKSSTSIILMTSSGDILQIHIMHCVKKMVLCKMEYLLHIYSQLLNVYWGYISQTWLNYLHYNPFILSPPVPEVKVFQDTSYISN